MGRGEKPLFVCTKWLFVDFRARWRKAETLERDFLELKEHTDYKDWLEETLPSLQRDGGKCFGDIVKRVPWSSWNGPKTVVKGLLQVHWENTELDASLEKWASEKRVEIIYTRTDGINRTTNRGFGWGWRDISLVLRSGIKIRDYWKQ